MVLRLQLQLRRAQALPAGRSVPLIRMLTDSMVPDWWPMAVSQPTAVVRLAVKLLLQLQRRPCFRKAAMLDPEPRFPAPLQWHHNISSSDGLRIPLAQAQHKNKN